MWLVKQNQNAQNVTQTIILLSYLKAHFARRMATNGVEKT